jgi:hypothetical protein
MHFKRHKPRSKGTSAGAFPSGTPAHWNILYHTRPRRRRDKNGERSLLKGSDSDAYLWDQADRKPHKYYW